MPGLFLAGSDKNVNANATMVTEIAGLKGFSMKKPALVNARQRRLTDALKGDFGLTTKSANVYVIQQVQVRRR